MMMQSSAIFSTKAALASAPLRVKALYSTSSGDSDSMAATVPGPKWAQKTITLPPHRRGCHLVTSQILKEIRPDLSEFKCGLAHLFLQHTSASLTINENYDSDVCEDTETFLNKIVPEGRSAPWKHTLEGPDDMPAHIKSSMFGCSLTIPITDGQLNMGTWQVTLVQTRINFCSNVASSNASSLDKLHGTIIYIEKKNIVKAKNTLVGKI